MITRCQHITFAALLALVTLFVASCEREPALHLHDEKGGNVEVDIPLVELDLDVYWDYDINFGVDYNWREEWYYGWDERDREVFGEIGYTKPAQFQLRRYHTGNTPYAPHTQVLKHFVLGNRFSDFFSFGYWDLLAWNEIEAIDGIQSLIIDEESTLDSVWAMTNPTMHPSRYHAPNYTRSFYQPEALFCGYDQATYISADREGFTYDPDRDVWVKATNLTLYPCTYIYLTQVILHNNRGRVDAVDGIANLSGMARTANLNTGTAGREPITVHYNVLLKHDCDMKGTPVDIIGGRLLTFGMCNVNGSRVDTRNGYPLYTKDGEVHVNDGKRHYIDVNMVFHNGFDSTFVFDVTDQVRKRFKGGVITIELDMDTVSIPSRSGGSGFDAVVKDNEDGGTHVFEM